MLVLDTDHLSFLQNDLSKEAARLTHRLDQAVGRSQPQNPEAAGRSAHRGRAADRA